MSGPKSSRYTLTAEQLQRIKEEQERRRKELEEKARKERECREIKQQLNDMKKKVVRHADYIEKLRLVNDDDGGQLGIKYESITKQLMELFSRKLTDYTEFTNAKRNAEKLHRDLVETENQLVAKLIDAKTQKAINEGRAIEEAMDVSFEHLGVVEEKENPTVKEAVRSLNELLELSISEELHNEILSSLEQVQMKVNDPELSSYIAITINPLKKRVAAFLQFREQSGDLFNLLHDKYVALCEKCGTSCEEFEFSEMGMTAMQNKMRELEDELLHDAEQVYISQAIDDVLVEMGYKVVGKRHVNKKSGKSFTSKLLTYSDGTVVNVTEASTGQVTMEIGGIDDHDRMPDANERVALRKKMEQFCKDFKDIEQRLAEKGVVLGARLSMAPPEELYAQIINASDYELNEEYQHEIEKHKVVSNGRTKTMRMD